MKMFTRENGKIFLLATLAAALVVAVTFRVTHVEAALTGKSDN
jgi:hypothetical protein